METWFLIVTTLCVAALIKALLALLSASYSPKIPPGPPAFPVIGNLLWLRKSSFDIEAILRSLHAKHGPMVALHVGSRPAIFISSRSLAHEALIQNGAVFADRPPAAPTSRIISCDQHNINTAFYGPTWRTLRRNLTAEILHPARVKSFSQARKWVLGILLDRLGSATAVQVVEHFQYAMFCLLVLMCFGDRLEEQQIKEVEAAQRALLLDGRRVAVINFWPRIGKILFRRRWKEFEENRRNQDNVLLPLIRARSEARYGILIR